MTSQPTTTPIAPELLERLNKILEEDPEALFKYAGIDVPKLTSTSPGPARWMLDKGIPDMIILHRSEGRDPIYASDAIKEYVKEVYEMPVYELQEKSKMWERKCYAWMREATQRQDKIDQLQKRIDFLSNQLKKHYRVSQHRMYKGLGYSGLESGERADSDLKSYCTVNNIQIDKDGQ